MKLARKGTMIGFVLLGVTAAAGVGYAAIPGADGQINGCYALSRGLLLGIPHSKGDVRIVDSAEACRPYEKPISWSQQGPKGDQGLPGVDGTDGVDGVDGANGAPGPAGPAGPAGPEGTSSPPAAKLAARPGLVDIPRFGVFGEVLRIDLPAGTWALTAKGFAVSAADRVVTACQLVSSGSVLDGARATVHEGSTTVPFSHATIVTLPTPAPVVLQCNQDSPIADHELRIGDTTIVAVAVNQI